MKTIFHINFVSVITEGEGSLGYARIEYDLSFVPTEDIMFEQPVWDNGRKPTSVSFNLEEASFYVHLGSDRISKDELASHAQMYRSHDWDVSD